MLIVTMKSSLTTLEKCADLCATLTSTLSKVILNLLTSRRISTVRDNLRDRREVPLVTLICRMLSKTSR